MSDKDKNTLTGADGERIKDALTGDGFPEPTEITIVENILSYNPNCGPRDAMIGTSALEHAGLNVAYDGDPSTTECGIDYDAKPIRVVIMVRDRVFK